MKTVLTFNISSCVFKEQSHGDSFGFRDGIFFKKIDGY